MSFISQLFHLFPPLPMYAMLNLYHLDEYVTTSFNKQVCRKHDHELKSKNVEIHQFVHSLMDKTLITISKIII